MHRHYSLHFIILIITLFNRLIISVISSTPDSPIESIAISCGSSGTLTAHNGRLWVGDSTLSLTPSLHLTGKSWSSRAQHKATVLIDPIPYQTARASRHAFSYRFSVKPGQKFIRLHFNPAPYKGFEKSVALFTVKAGPYTLLSRFSPALAAESLGVKILHKEFCVTVQESESWTITFTPSQETDVYAVVNGIEIASMPAGLYFTPEGDPGALVVGQKHRFYIDTSTALEMVQRLNVGGHSFSCVQFRDWEDDYSYLLEGGVVSVSLETAMKIKYPEVLRRAAPLTIYQTARSAVGEGDLTWRIPVDLGFRYLVRLHFCEFDPQVSARGERQFSILINNRIAEENGDVMKWSGGGGIAVYRDYVAMVEGDRMKGTGNLLIRLSSKRRDGILNGLEIFKLSNPDNCLAGAQIKTSKVTHRQRLEPVSSVDRKHAIATAFTVAITLLNIAMYRLRCLSQAANSTTSNRKQSSVYQTCREFTLEEIQLATNNFSPEFLIGVGGYGKVYKGSIDCECGSTIVAIKRLKEGSSQGESEFWTEIKMLSKARNEHLVSLIGFCNEEKEMVLVYEYMPQGTLADHLHRVGKPPLTWEQRLKISIGAARGLHYLHTFQPMVIHRDVKSSNILLDESWVTKISDFGLSRMGPENESVTHISTGVKGTFGYFDPEYFLTRRLTTKSDVYSFGVVLLEVLTGRPALDKRLVAEQKSLATWAADYMRNGKVHEIVDKGLARQVSQTCLEVLVEVAGRCLHKQPHERPDMAHVVTSLELVLALQQKENGAISLDDQCGPMDQGRDNNIGSSSGRIEKHRSSKSNALVRWWDSLWVSLKQPSRTKPSSTQPRIPKQPSKRNFASPTQLQGRPRHFSPLDILQATDNFSQSSVIGFVESDMVYIGFLDGGESTVAIRRAMNAESVDHMVEELEWNIENFPLPIHTNVFSIIGYSSRPMVTLVYNYMANGSLHDHLHDPEKDPLPWNQRLKICIDAGRGLSYLQPILKQSILHRELNSTNIMLDENWVGKVSEFCWCRRKGIRGFPAGQFMDSDYVRHTTSTEKLYAYAFGVLLIEVLCVNSELTHWNWRDEDQESVARCFKSHLSSGTIYRCIDKSIVGKISPGCLQMFIDTISSCLHDQGRRRPTMSEIVTSLEAALKLQQKGEEG